MLREAGPDGLHVKDISERIIALSFKSAPPGVKPRDLDPAKLSGSVYTFDSCKNNTSFQVIFCDYSQPTISLAKFALMCLLTTASRVSWILGNASRTSSKRQCCSRLFCSQLTFGNSPDIKYEGTNGVSAFVGLWWVIPSCTTLGLSHLHFTPVSTNASKLLHISLIATSHQKCPLCILRNSCQPHPLLRPCYRQPTLP